MVVRLMTAAATEVEYLRVTRSEERAAGLGDLDVWTCVS